MFTVATTSNKVKIKIAQKLDFIYTHLNFLAIFPSNGIQHQFSMHKSKIDMLED